MACFHKAYERAIPIEGIRSNHPRDIGGDTLYGVAKNYHPITWAKLRDALRKGEDVYPILADFYLEEFWNPFSGDHIDSQLIANEIFEAGVNCGIKTAVSWAQAAYNFFRNLRGRDSWPPALVTDGVIGPKTLEALNYVHERDYDRAITARQNVIQALHYDTRPLEYRDDFLLGWYNHRIDID